MKEIPDFNHFNWPHQQKTLIRIVPAHATDSACNDLSLPPFSAAQQEIISNKGKRGVTISALIVLLSSHFSTIYCT